MHFHTCGNWAHDIFHNTLVFLSMAPDWLPLLRAWSCARLARLPSGQHHDAA